MKQIKKFIQTFLKNEEKTIWLLKEGSHDKQYFVIILYSAYIIHMLRALGRSCEHFFAIDHSYDKMDPVFS